MADTSTFDTGLIVTNSLSNITNPLVGKTWAFVYGSDGGTVYRCIGVGPPAWESIAGGGTPPAGMIYVTAAFYSGVIPASQLLVFHPVTEDVTIKAGAPKCHGKTLVAATATTTFSMQKNGVQFGTMQFAPSAPGASFTVLSDTSFSQASNDDFRMIAPVTPDATLATVSFGIWGQR